MPRHDPVPLSEVDLADIDGFQNERSFAQFDTLREQDPVHWNPEPEPNSGFWAITRYEDIWTVDKDPETFTSEAFVNLEEVDPEDRDARRSMLETDGERHEALRKLIVREFAPRQLMKNYEGFLRELTRKTLDAAFEKAANGQVIDFVEEISADFPINVLARLLDVPQEDTAQLIAWGNEFVGNTDPDFAKVLMGSEDSEKYKHLPFRSPTVQEVFDYGTELKNRRRGGDGTDLVSILANKMPQDGVPLSDRDFNMYFTLLVIAGNETTRHAISNIMFGLMEQRDALKALQEDPSLIPAAAEELIRWASPVYHFRRTATRDVVLHGKEIKAGDKVVMWFASGNRDNTVFADPYKIDVHRRNVDHMTFGKGSPHLCLGNNLARMEIRLMFEELLPRLEDIQHAGEVKRVRSNFVNGIKAFPVTIKQRTRRTAVSSNRPTDTVVREFEADLVLSQIEHPADDVCELTLANPDGSPLPAWTPGAHIDLLQPSGLVRQYSLCSSPGDLSSYRVSVLKAPDSRGGSTAVHALNVGDTVRIRGPRNHFPLVAAPRYVFIAGGIGITPMLPMIEEAIAAGADWHLYYGGRTKTSMTYAEKLAEHGDRVTLIPQDTDGLPDLDTILGSPDERTLVYCCGPEPLLAAVEQRCSSWPDGALHLERFAAKKIDRDGEDESFEIVLQRSGITATVEAGESVFDTMRAHGVAVLGSCLEGICGTCETGVLEGEVDHRDSVLNAAEQASNDCMMVCVSRAKKRPGEAGKLVLDA